MKGDICLLIQSIFPMKARILGYISVCTLIALCLFVRATMIDADAAETDLDQLKKLNARFIHNFVTNDTASHNKIIGKDFLLITGSGRKVNRKDYLNAWAHGFDPAVYAYWDYRDEMISIYGSCALVRSVNKFKTRKEGKTTEGMTRYTDTYIKENGEWKCAQAQLTSVSPENYPGDDTIVKKYINGKIQ
jgi:ketosteroid isomerase-like protein